MNIFKNSYMLYFLSREIFGLLLKIFFRVKFHGRDLIPEPPFIVTSNHASLVDPPLVGVACNKCSVDFMAKNELFDIPVVGSWTRSVHCIEVKRGNNSIGSLKDAIKTLKSGRTVGIFPEGTRSTDGSLQEAKRGIGFIVSKAQVPVVPCYVRGSGEAFPKGNLIKLGTHIDVFVGKPINPEELIAPGSKDYASVSTRIMDRIAELQEKSDKQM